MLYLVLVLSVMLFMVGIRIVGLMPRSHEILVDVRAALNVMRSPVLDDSEKEKAIQQAAVKMMVKLFELLVRLLPVLLVPVFFVMCFGYFGLFSTQEVVSVAGSWQFIALSSFLMMIIFCCAK